MRQQNCQKFVIQALYPFQKFLSQYFIRENNSILTKKQHNILTKKHDTQIRYPVVSASEAGK